MGFGRTINESAAAQDEVNSLLKWANDNAVAFDIENPKLVNFLGVVVKSQWESRLGTPGLNLLSIYGG